MGKHKLIKFLFPRLYHEIWTEGYKTGTTAIRMLDNKLKEITDEINRQDQDTR
jgi:hypothetical protein